MKKAKAIPTKQLQPGDFVRIRPAAKQMGYGHWGRGILHSWKKPGKQAWVRVDRHPELVLIDMKDFKDWTSKNQKRRQQEDATQEAA